MHLMSHFSMSPIILKRTIYNYLACLLKSHLEDLDSILMFSRCSRLCRRPNRGCNDSLNLPSRRTSGR